MTRYDGHAVLQATVLRILRRRALILAADYQRERRQLAAARRAVFVEAPARASQVWQLDFSEFETVGGGTWRIAACTDYWSKALCVDGESARRGRRHRARPGRA